MTPGAYGDRMQSDPKAPPEQLFANCQPVLGGLPKICTGMPGAGVCPEYWSRKNENDVGVAYARLNVTRKLLFESGLKSSAARGENWYPSTRELASTRAATRKSN